MPRLGHCLPSQFRSILIFALALTGTGCKSDPLVSDSSIKERAAWIGIKRHEMRSEAHRRGLGSICVLPVTGQTNLMGAWQSPQTQLQVDENERRTIRSMLADQFKIMGFSIVDREEAELQQIESTAANSPRRRLSLLGHIGRTLGVEIVASIRLDLIREAYFVPYVGWKTRGFPVLSERYWDARSDSLLAEFVWDERSKKFLIRDMESTPYFQGFEALGATTIIDADRATQASAYLAATNAATLPWQANYVIGVWFTNEGRVHPNASDVAVRHLVELRSKTKTGEFLSLYAEAMIAEQKLDRSAAADKLIEAVKALSSTSSLRPSVVAWASRLSGKSEEAINAELGVDSSSLATPGAIPATSRNLDAWEQSVVWVICEQGDDDAVTGSGFAVASGGSIVTNAHVVENAKSIRVKYWDGVWGNAEVVARDLDFDLALLEVARRDIPTLPLRTGDIHKGESVFVIGYPSGLENTITKGIVSGFRDTEGWKLVQTDAAINPGNSGGPIIDENGNVVAVATLRMVDREGLNFGVHFSHIDEFLRRFADSR